MKKIFLWLGIISVIAGGIMLSVYGFRIYSISRFVMGWQERFPECRDKLDRLPIVDIGVGIPEGSQVPEPFEGAKLVKASFPDGSWVVVAEHDAHDDGIGWDQAVFYDSRGEMRVTDHHFCDWEGLLGEMMMYSKKAGTLDDFYKAAAGQIKFK